MKSKLIAWPFLIVAVLSFPILAQAAPNSPQDPNLLSDKTPSQLVELWDEASPPQRSLIYEKLFDNIPDAVPVLRDKILTGSQKQKLLACSVVAEMRDTNSIPILIQAMDDLDNKVKTRAIVSLKDLHAKEAANKIRQQMPKEKNKAVLKVSIAALGTLGNKGDISGLKAYLSDSDESVRVNAAAALALLGNYEGENILLVATQNANPAVKKEATYSLGFVNTTASRNKLQEIINDPNGQWKSYAQIAIGQQELTNNTAAQQMKLLEGLVKDKNPRVADWAVEKIAGIDIPQADDILKEIEKDKTETGKKAVRSLKVREAKK